MRKCRKMISVIMLVVMLVSLLPSGAMAAEIPDGGANDAIAVEQPESNTDVEENEEIKSEGTDKSEEIPANTSVSDVKVEDGTDGVSKNEEPTDLSKDEEATEGDTENSGLYKTTTEIAAEEEPTEDGTENAGTGESTTDMTVEVNPAEETVIKEAKSASSYDYEIELDEVVPVKELAVTAGLITEEEAEEFVAGIASIVFGNDCIKITQGGDWMLECVKVFQLPENLTITMSDGTVHTVSVTCGTDVQVDFLDGDWAFISEFGLNTEEGIIDGTEAWDNLDEGSSNKKVRTLDVVTYNMHYSTELYADTGLTNIMEGYMCYKFVLPADQTQAEWATASMGWLGTEYNNAAELESATAAGGSARESKSGGYYKYTDGDGNQVIVGKRYMTPTETNPYAFPGSGTLAATVQVYMPIAGFKIEPEFYLWVDHNTEDGDCEEHEKNEVKHFVADPVEVVSELRLNVDIKAATANYSAYIGNYEFDNADVVNNGEGTVYGATAIYGVTLQLYNKDIDKGLRGCALPVGDISFDVNFNATYSPNDGEPVDLMELGYQPLVYAYGYNNNRSTITGREIPTGVPGHAVNCCPTDGKNRNAGAPFESNTSGTYLVWNGGNWDAEQNGITATLTNSDYVINPNWFPNSITSNNVHRSDYYDYTQGVRACDVGSFSALKLYVVYPVKFVTKDGEEIDLLEKYGPGSISSRASDVNLRAKTNYLDENGNINEKSLDESETNDNQKNLDDDSAPRAIYLSDPGRYSTIIRYNETYTTNTKDTLGGGDYLESGHDSAAIGQTIGLTWTLNASTNGNESAMISAAQSLIKLDADALQLSDLTHYADSNDPNVEVTFLYGAYDPGDGDVGRNWNSIDEQNAARETDFVWYSSYQEIEAQGKKCTAVLAEWRIQNGQAFYSNKQLTTGIQATVRNDLSLCGNTYPIIIVEDFWTRKNMADLEMDINDFPSRLDVQNGTAVMPELPDDAWYNSSLSNNPLVKNYHEIASNYTMAVYENGVFKDEHIPSSHHFGDTLYIIQYKARIKKNLGQKNDNGSDHKVFDLDNGQRVADYRLDVELTTDQPALKVNTTTVTVTDILPKGLSYIPGSAYCGGEYTQGLPGKQGTVTGGVSHDPDLIEENEDGTTTLTWIIEDANIGENLPPIYYSCDIGHAGAPDDVINNQSLLNTATVMTTEDIREPEKYNGKLDDVSIQVSKLIATSVSKVADRKFVETTDDIGWTMNVGNNAINDINNAVMLDTLPAHGDKAGSRIASDNKMKITEWTIDTTTATNVDTWIAFYTTDEKTSQFISSDFAYDSAAGTLVGNPYSENYEESNTIAWTPVEINISGDSATIPGIYGIENITGVAVVGTLKGKETYQAHMTVNYSDPLEDGAMLINTISRGDDKSTSTVYTVVRSLEGIVWKDTNMDGYRDHSQSNSEEVISGVQATLMKLKDGGDAANPEDYEPYIINLKEGGTQPAVVQTGKVLDVRTGEEKAYDLGGDEYDIGRYRFDGLPEGTFAVKFEAGSYSNFAASIATKVNEGNDSFDSDAEPTYSAEDELISAFIADIDMPPVSKIKVQHYVSKYHDLGLYQVGDLEVTKTVISNLADDKDVEFSFTITLGNTTINGTFGNMEFTDGVATFNLKDGDTKVATGLPVGVTYEVTETAADGFTLTHVNGEVKAKAEGTISTTKSTAEFENTRDTGSLEIKKVVSSALNSDMTKQFTFTLEMKKDGKPLNGSFGQIIEFVDGKVTIKLKHNDVMTITGIPVGTTFTVKETSDSGFTMDPEDGVITGTISSTTAKAEFTNTRKTGSLTVKKTIESSMLSDKSKNFLFTVTLKDEAGNPVSGTFGTGTSLVTFDANGQVSFNLTDKQSKTIDGLPVGTSYTVTETSADGFITLVNGEEKLVAEGTITETGATEAFLNKKDEGGLMVTKSVKSDIEADFDKEFTFTLKLDPATPNETIGEVTFDENGAYEFKLKSGDVKSFTGLPIGSKYIVTETGDDDFTVEPAIGVIRGTIGRTLQKPLVFKNTRKKGSLKISKEVDSCVPAEKTAEYKFTVTLKNGDQYLNKTYGDYAFDENGQAEVTVKGGASVTIPDIPVGTTYEVKESEDSKFTVEKTNATGTITTEQAKVEAKIKNIRKKGSLEVTKTVVNRNTVNTATDFNFTVTLSDLTISGKFGDMTFTNGIATFALKHGEKAVATGLPTEVGYTVTETEVTGFTPDKTEETGTISGTASTAAFTNTYTAAGKYSPEVRKALNGRPLEKDQFTFTLTDKDGNELQAKNDAAGRVYFDDIEYDQDDMNKDENGNLIDTDVVYTAKEVFEKKDGYTYSKEEYTITVTLHDNMDGTITATADKKPEDCVFHNTYEATGKIELPALKKLLGERALEEGQFTFKLKNEAGDVLSTKTNGADGSVLFDAIEYTQDDIYTVDEYGVYSGANTKTYNYTISEEIPEGAVDNGDGTFFLNGYTYDGTVYNVAVVITDNGDGTITAVVAGTEDGADAGDTETGDTEAGGDAAGGTGTEGTPGDIENGEDTEPEETVETEYVFANAYDANGTLKLDARKVFDHGVIKGGEFTFELKDAEGEVLQTKTNDAKGNVSFEMLTYDMKDLAGAPYVYTVSEVTGKDANVEYDKTVYTVTVDLADNGDGTLKVTKKIDNGGELVFTNKQLNVQTSIKLGGIKVLKGKDLKDGQFTFVLSDESGKNVMKAKNDANGNFTFDEITYKLEDLKGEKKKVYIYGISEINDKQSGIVYDDKAYTVKVTVTDNGDGTMTALADTAIEEVRFTNSVSTKSNKTGDSANGALWALLLLMAGGALAGTVWYKRRKKV